MFCVYLTTYRGNKMPPFYIGSSSVAKIRDGYKGSVSSMAYRDIWKQEVRDNPHLFRTTIVSISKTRQDALERESTLQRALGVIKSPLYINQAYAVKNGYCGRNVSGPLNPNYGKTASEEMRAKMRKPHTMSAAGLERKREAAKKRVISEAVRSQKRNMMAGPNNPQYGKMGEAHPAYGRKHDADTIARIKASNTGKKRTPDQIKKGSTSYEVERLDGTRFVGYGLTSFSKMLGVGASSFLYTLTSHKFMCGYRIMANLGRAKDYHQSLIEAVTTNDSIPRPQC